MSLHNFIRPIHIYGYTFNDQFGLRGEGGKNEQSKVDWKLGLFPVNSTLLSFSPPNQNKLYI